MARLAAAAVAGKVNSQYTTQTLDDEIHFALRRCAPPALKKKIIRNMIENAEAFRNPEQPGHETWYAHHLQLAARAVVLLTDSPAAT